MSTAGDDDLGVSYAKLPIKNENQEAGEAQESETIACHVCDRVFMSKKSLHGHMRSHPARAGLGSVTPSMEEETAELLLLLSGSSAPLHRKYCHEDFETRHALVRHQARHGKRQGCHAKAKDSGRRRGGRSDDEAAGQPSAAEISRRGRMRKNKRPLLDLNKPPSGSNDGSGGSESSSSDNAGEEE